MKMSRMEEKLAEQNIVRSNSMSFNKAERFGGKPKMFFGTAFDPKLIFPVAYPDTLNLLENSRANHWIPQEIAMSVDSSQFESLDPFAKQMYTQVLSYLTASDNTVPGYLLQVASQAVTSCELLLFLLRQGEEEAIHTESYRYMLEHLQISEQEISNLLQLTNEVPELREKLNWNIAHTNELAYIFAKWTIAEREGTIMSKQAYEDLEREAVRTLYRGMLAYLVFEFIYFPIGFTIFYGIRVFGKKMLGSDAIIRYIMRDEFNHAKNTKMCLLKLEEEHAKHLPEDFKRKAVEEIFNEAIELEFAVADRLFVENSLYGSYTKQQYKHFMLYLVQMAKRSINKLGDERLIDNPIASWINPYYTSMIQYNKFEVTDVGYVTKALKFSRYVPAQKSDLIAGVTLV